MMKKNSKNNKGEILLTDVSNKLSKARNLVTNVPYELHDLANYLASVVGNYETVPMGMIILLIRGLDDIKKGHCGFDSKVLFLEELKEEKERIFIYISYFPLIVDKIASKEFAEEFRAMFTIMFGETQPPVDDTQEEFGVTIIEKGVEDISNKDKAEVLAALYK